MALRHDKRCPVAGHSRLLQVIALWFALHDAEIDRQVRNGFGDLLRIAYLQVQRHAGMRQPESLHQRRQPIVRHRLAGPKPQHPTAQARQIVQRLHSQCRAGENGAGLVQEGMPGLRQHDAPPNPVKQLHVMTLFQRSNRRACRTLGQVQRLGRAGHVFPLGDGDENAELFERH